MNNETKKFTYKELWTVILFAISRSRFAVVAPWESKVPEGWGQECDDKGAEWAAEEATILTNSLWFKDYDHFEKENDDE